MTPKHMDVLKAAGTCQAAECKGWFAKREVVRQRPFIHALYGRRVAPFHGSNMFIAEIWAAFFQLRPLREPASSGWCRPLTKGSKALRDARGAQVGVEQAAAETP